MNVKSLFNFHYQNNPSPCRGNGGEKIMQAPWTEIGRLQQDVQQLKNQLSQKANDYEIHETNRRLDSLEYSCRKLSSQIDGLLARMQEMEESRRHE